MIGYSIPNLKVSKILFFFKKNMKISILKIGQGILHFCWPIIKVENSSKILKTKEMEKEIDQNVTPSEEKIETTQETKENNEINQEEEIEGL